MTPHRLLLTRRVPLLCLQCAATPLAPLPQVTCTVLLLAALMACATSAAPSTPNPEPATAAATAASATPRFSRRLTQGAPEITWPGSQCTRPTYFNNANGEERSRCPTGLTGACCQPGSNTCIRLVDKDVTMCPQGADVACCPSVTSAL